MLLTRHLLISLRIALVAACFVLQPLVHVRSEIQGPYEPDQHTLHLYHFDNEENTTEDAATKSSKYSLKRSGDAATADGFQDFGKSLNTQLKTEARTNTSGTLPTSTFWNEETHAFTYEALVRMDFDPNEIMIGRAERMTIFALDSSGKGYMRSFHLSLRPLGVAGATTSSLVFVKYAGPDRGAIQTITLELPLTGLHAPVRGKWFHVAVTYNGNAGAADNLKVYWTRVDRGATRAELLASASLEKNPSKQTTSFFSVGNTARKSDGYVENWLGQIDEVRISDVARKDDEFLFRPEKRPSQEAPKESPGDSALQSKK